MIMYTYISGQDCVLRSRMVAPSYCPFELSPLNELYIERLCAQYLLYPLRYFDDIWYTYISGQDEMSRAIIVSPPGCPFELSPFNEHKSGKLVHSNSYNYNCHNIY